METFIAALGTAVPIHQRTQAHAAEFITNLMGLKNKKHKQLLSIFANSGIEYRHSVLADYTKAKGDYIFFPNAEDDKPFPSTAKRMQIYKQEALELALVAVKNCLSQMVNFSVSQITHIITVSCTGMYTPGLDIELVQRLNLPGHTQRTAINFMGCYGAFNGLKAANAICRAYPEAHVLLVSVELCSLHVQKNPILDNIIASAIFSDGAAAALIQSQTSAMPALALEHFYCDMAPNSEKDMAWHIGDVGFEMALSAYVPDIIKSGINTFCHKLLAQKNYTLADIDLYAIHPGGKKILESCEAELGLQPQDNRYAYSVLKNHGNMSSATILFVLKALLEDSKKSDHNKKILSLGFGPGLTLESMLLRIKFN